MQSQPAGKGEQLKNHHIESHQEIAKSVEETAVKEAVEKPFAELAETKFYDFTGDKWTSFFRKVIRFLDFTKYLGGAINSHTIIRGVLEKSDPEAIKEKHALLQKMGGEHLKLKSETHEEVDAHFIDASKFQESLEKMGGERKVIKFELPNDSVFTNAKLVNLEIKGQLPISLYELSSKEFTNDEIIGLSQSFKKFELYLIKDDATGKYYAIDYVSYERLSKSKYVEKEPVLFNFKNFVVSKSKDRPNFLEINDQSFPAIIFDKAQWEAVNKPYYDKTTQQSKFQGFFENSSWEVFQTDDKVYLIPKENAPSMKLYFFPPTAKEIQIKMNVADEGPIHPNNKTILVTQNQTATYEQTLPEIWSYALQGINVLAYNNPGKGLSKGLADRTNINASIEAAYQYLHEIRKIKDEDILAKGECFGGAPTAWLGRKHPQINLMLDQNPANFYEIAMKFIRTVCEEAMSDKPKDQETQEYQEFLKYLRSWAPYIMTLDFIVEGLVKAVFSGYNVPDDIAKNKGHKLVNINVPINNRGGDELVPEHHPALMIDAFSVKTEEQKEQKVLKLSMNPGGKHVTPWWLGTESRKSVLDFFGKAGFLGDFKTTHDFKEIPNPIAVEQQVKAQEEAEARAKEEERREMEDFLDRLNNW